MSRAALSMSCCGPRVPLAFLIKKSNSPWSQAGISPLRRLSHPKFDCVGTVRYLNICNVWMFLHRSS